MTQPVELSTPSDREIVLERAFDAPRELVFEAWIRPELLARWYGARGWQLVECDLDPRVGGGYRFVSRGPGGATMVQRGTYRALVVPELIVHTERFDDQSYPGETLVSHTFTAGPDGSATVTSTVRFPSRAARDRVLRYPMARGVAEGYQRLDALLASKPQS